MPVIESLRDASPEQVEERLEEIRGDFIELHDGRRSDLDDDGVRSLVREADVLDTFLTLSAAQQEREQRKIAATAGAITDGGVRSVGEAWMSDDVRHWAERDGTGLTSMQINDERLGTGTRTSGPSIDLDGEDGKRVSRWLRAAGIYGGEAGLRDVTEWAAGGPTTFDGSDAGGLIPRLGQPIPPVPRVAKLYLRDLIPSFPTTFPIVPYVRELNPVTYESAASGGATTVAEGGLKPSAQLSFVSANAPVTVVATTLKMSKAMFADAAAVVAYVNQRLPYLVKLDEDFEILKGSGTWPDVTGILNTPGILTQAATAGESAITIGNAFAKVEGQDGVPTAVVMNPADAWGMFTKRAAGGSGTFDAGTPFSALPLTVWGVPTYRSRVYASGTCLVADFQRGAMIADRESVNLQTYNERYAEVNMVLLICEERFGVLTLRPDLFVQTTLS